MSNFGDKFSKDEKELEKKQKEHEAEKKKKLKPLVDKLVEIGMKERRKNAIESPKGGSPKYMREDPTTPLIREVPFGPDTRMIESYEHGNPKNYDHISHSRGTGEYEINAFDKFEAEQNKLPKDKQFPKFGDVTGKGTKTEFDNKGNEVDVYSFRVIPHGGISIPKEQERIVRPMEKRNYEHGKLKAKAKRNHQRDEDAIAIVLDIMNDETPSRFVNRKTKKIRPDKPVRSDFASIISAEKGFSGIIDKETIFRVGEHDKPEFVQVTPLFRTGKHGKVYNVKKPYKLLTSYDNAIAIQKRKLGIKKGEHHQTRDETSAHTRLHHELNEGQRSSENFNPDRFDRMNKILGKTRRN